MTYIQKGFELRQVDSSLIKEKLENKIYLLNQDSNGLFLKEQEDSFILPKKLYGNPELITNRVLNYFNTKNKSVGISLMGSKGSGKTMTAKLLCNQAQLPVILISSSYYGEDFNEFIAKINQKCIIFFDEFEKIYSNEEQNQLLSLLDGGFKHKCIFIFTCNNEYNQYLKNRLSRVRFNISYSILEDSIIEEIIEDNLVNKQHKESIFKLIDLIPSINIDTLFGLIEEMNLNNESAEKSIKYLNVDLENTLYYVTCKFKGKDIMLDYATFNGNFNKDKFNFSLYSYKDYQNSEGNWLEEYKELKELDDEGSILLKDCNFVKKDSAYVFAISENCKLYFNRNNPNVLRNYLL